MALEKPGNYTLGRGRLYLARSIEQGPANGFRYVGNTPALDMTVESENLDHFSSDAGVRELDARVTLQVTRSGTFSMDDIQPENLALFVRGEAKMMSRAETAGQSYPIVGAIKGIWYQVGQTATRPEGQTDLTGVTVNLTGGAVVPAVQYDLNPAMGLVRFKGAFPDDATNVTVSYTLGAIAHTRDEPRTQVLSGFAAVRGSLMFLENNPAGRSRKYFFPNVEISANGAASLKGDEWRAMPMSFGVLKPPLGGEAVYIDNIPSTVEVPTD